jgi:type IV pilus assembly protein PilA
MAMTVAITRSPSTNMFIGAGVLAVLPTFVLPIFANAIYWHHVNRMVERLPRSVASVPDKRIARLERNGGTAVGPMLGIMLGSSVVFVIPMLAAISIPAYQDYTLRSQVTEGLNLAGSLKAEVAEYYAVNKTWPDMSDLGHKPPSGKYVREVIVKQGTVVITYGNQANSKLQEQKLAIRPGVNAEGDIAWACGNHLLPDGFDSGRVPTAATWPTSGCRLFAGSDRPSSGPLRT